MTVEDRLLEGPLNEGWDFMGYHEGLRYGRDPLVILFWKWNGDVEGDGWVSVDGGQHLQCDKGDGVMLEVIPFGGEHIWQVRMGNRAMAKGSVRYSHRLLEGKRLILHLYEGVGSAAKPIAEAAWCAWVGRGSPDPTLYPLRLELRADGGALLGPRPAPALTMNSVVRVPVDKDEG
jgi:hypothetical protein